MTRLNNFNACFKGVGYGSRIQPKITYLLVFFRLERVNMLSFVYLIRSQSGEAKEEKIKSWFC